MTSELLEIFNAHSGVVCCVGAGGKKTTMFQLANAHSGKVGITATAHIEYFPKTLAATNYIGTEDELLEAIKNDNSSKTIAFARPSERFGRRAGINPEMVQTFKEAGRFDLMLIKADGARSRFIKAPAKHEPPIPDVTTTVIPIISAKVIGMNLTEKIAHRIDQISNITGLNENDEIKPVHLAQLFSSEQGSLKNTGDAKVIPLINMVDYSEQEVLARKAAIESLSLTDRFDRVVLAAMKETHPIVDVITR
ncbi:MAG: putative selenium-dependent hydroxylase accessory protein YqeC [Proteobacteria bacterium]|nr:putative selenium-dependent hydroxylase accessory protein YqeC [Pseudomonadota bacterium]